MRRLLALCLLALATCGQAADTTRYYGPDGTAMQPGKYWSVTVHSDGSQPTVALIVDVGGDVPPPPPPPPPPPDDVAKKIASYLAAVTDPDKALVQSKLAAGYKATLTFVDNGTITDAVALKTIQQSVDKSLLRGMRINDKPADKTAAWKPWTDGMIALVAATDLPTTAAIYRVAQAALDGGPVPPPPPPPPPPPTAGLHVLIIDDENVRGELPQEQINIFTSKKLMDYLDSKCAKESDGEPAYRFSSNDSLAPGEEARDLELKVWVEGWDAVMAAVNSGKVKLPAWAVTNGTRGVIESLPGSVDAAIARIKEFE